MPQKNLVTLLVIAGLFMACGFGLGWFLRGTAVPGQTIEQHTYAMLQQNVRNGMTVDRISELLGAHMLERNYQIPDSIADHYERMFQSRGSAITTDDEICAIRIGNTTLVLHFRDNRLINCQPDIDFGDPETAIAGVAG